MTDTDKTEELFARELTLLLLYLASWTEAEGLPPRAWKNHRFEIIRELTEKGYLFDSKGRKSALLTPKGVAVAQKLEEKYRRRGRAAAGRRAHRKRREHICTLILKNFPWRNCWS